jgi:hypothetical protein
MTEIVSMESITDKIYLIQDKRVMLDRDLASLYGVQTKVLKQAVRRNIKRFPEDFMFELSKEDFKNWRSQFVTSNRDRMGLRYPPMAFTEQGVAMLSSKRGRSCRNCQKNIQARCARTSPFILPRLQFLRQCAMGHTSITQIAN